MTIKYECLGCNHKFNLERPGDGLQYPEGHPKEFEQILFCPKQCGSKYFKWINFVDFMKKKASKELKQIYNGC